MVMKKEGKYCVGTVFDLPRIRDIERCTTIAGFVEHRASPNDFEQELMPYVEAYSKKVGCEVIFVSMGRFKSKREVVRVWSRSKKRGIKNIVFDAGGRFPKFVARKKIDGSPLTVNVGGKIIDFDELIEVLEEE